MSKRLIGVIGGSGLGQAFAPAQTSESVFPDTPFGKPSGPIVLTDWQGQRVAFLSRHGPGHVLNPTRVPYRANIFALKKLGVTHILASGATGSLRERIRPRDLVVIDQVIDKTFKRDGTFFDDALAVHVEFSSPFCPHLRAALLSAAPAAETTVHDGGVYVCMEGPQFSTAAEAGLHRQWGGDLIGMTCMPEAKLAREAEICYAMLSLPTDYDSWRPHDPTLTPTALMTEIIGNLEHATENAIRLLQQVLADADRHFHNDCNCRHALQHAIWSDKNRIDRNKLHHLEPLLKKYLNFND